MKCFFLASMTIVFGLADLWQVNVWATQPQDTPATNQTTNEILPANSTPPATQENAVAPADSTQTKSLEDLLGEFKSNDLQLSQMEADYKSATDDTKKSDIRTEYVALLNKTDQLVSDLRAAALERVQATPTDVAMQKTLLGVLIQEAQNNHDQEVLAAGEVLISLGVDTKLLETAAGVDRLSIPAREIFEELILRQADATANLPRVKVNTDKGAIEIELFEDQAPNTVANFIELAGKKFYDGVKFHRVIDGFMAQTGDPKGDGSGGPGYTIACECYTPEARRHFVGSVSMAKTQARDSGGSQFFIVFERSEGVQQLDGKHTVFGRVISGMDVAQSLTRTHKSDFTGETKIEGAVPCIIQTVEIVRKRDHEYVAKKIGETPANPPTPPPSQPEHDSFEKAKQGEDEQPSSNPEKSGDGKSEGDKSGG